MHELCELHGFCTFYELCKLYELCQSYEYFMNRLKSHEITQNHLDCFKQNIFGFKNFEYLFLRMENSNYKNKTIEQKNTQTLNSFGKIG